MQRLTIFLLQRLMLGQVVAQLNLIDPIMEFELGSERKLEKVLVFQKDLELLVKDRFMVKIHRAS